jgi:transcriptional regulator with XRE-family HTH domain
MRTNATKQRVKLERQSGLINKTFGEIVRHLRHKSGMTIEELALASKVSRAMLSSVERGEKSPTLSVLTGIASGLNVTLSRLMAESASSSVASVIRRQDRMVFRDQETGIERHLLSPTHLDTGIELVEHVLPSGQRFAGGPRQGITTDKYVVVQEGTLTVEIDGKLHELVEEDSMYFRIIDNYCFVNNNPRPCRYYLFIVHRR